MQSKWIPPEPVDTIEWLDDEFVLPAEAGDSAGSYDPDYVPYFWGVAAAIDDPVVKFIVMQKAAQIGWTFFLVGVLCKRIGIDPCTILMVFPKDGAAREFSEEKLEPAIKATPPTAKVLDVTKSRSSGSRATKKMFPGGFIKMVGGNSASNVKSTPAQFVIVEEPDDTSENVGDQGDAITLTKERIKRQPSGQFYLGGTPSVEGVSHVAAQLKLTNRMVLPITCHECGESHKLEWENVFYDDDENAIPHIIYKQFQPETAYYKCPHCQAQWNDYQRKKNVLDTCRNARDRGEQYCGWVPTVDAPEHAVGFEELSELYVCMPGTSLADVVRSDLEATHLEEQGDQKERIVFQNSKLAKTYQYKSDAPEEEELAERALDYKEFTVPAGAFALTAGVDIQHDRIAIIIRAWGRGEESWLVFWGEILAENSCTDKKDPVWRELDKLLFREFRHEFGTMLKLSAVSIDSSDGKTNDAVYNWVRRKKTTDVMAIKGESAQGVGREIFTTPKKIDTDKRNTKASKYGLGVYMVGTNKAKDLIYSRIELPGDGPGRMHFYKDVREDYCKQLLSEIKMPATRGSKRMVWTVKSGVRNEGLDCEVYALHAARAKKIHMITDSRADAMEQALRQRGLFAESKEQIIAPPIKKRGRRVRSK